ncbi:Ribonuclease H1 [Blastocladiella emersonii ATCC 22665]|nr:Ribonuclease H1 [Blastocladiella emersonii ATCC 22665]
MGHIAAAKLPPGPFSSTRAEIHAFVLAVSQVAAGTALHIYSDSQAAIEAARTQLSPTATVRQRVQCALSDLWSALRLALRDRNVKITFSWVRGHADDSTMPNNVADRAAKAAANQPPASDAYFLKRTRTEPDLHHVPAIFDHKIGGGPRKFMRDLAQAECHEAVLAENVTHLALAQPPPPEPEPADTAAAAANKEASFRLRALTNKLPCRESLHSVGRIAVPTCGRAECAAERNPEARCIPCWNADFKASWCSCGLQDTPFHWFQCKLMDEQRVKTLDQISESWLSQLTSVGAAKHDAALKPAAGTLIDALLGPDLLHVMHLNVNTLRADRDAAFATRVAAIPAWAIARRGAKEAGQLIPGEDALPPLLDLPDAAAIRLSACAITRGAVHACREFLGCPAAAAAATALHPLPEWNACLTRYSLARDAV